MPTYDYRCKNDHRHEELRKIADRKDAAECPECGESADFVLTAPRIDPRMFTPGAMMKWRKGAEARGRGKDLTYTDRTENSDDIMRDAHNVRKALGETKIITGG
jgi:putative FmdB family regulatory protein